MLASNYPRLVTVALIAQDREDPGGILSKPPGCGEAAVPE